MQYNTDWEGKLLKDLPKEALIEIIIALEARLRESEIKIAQSAFA